MPLSSTAATSASSASPTSGQPSRIRALLARYHAIVFSRPSSSSTFGSQPSTLARLLDVRDAQLDVDVAERREDDLARAAGEALDPLGEVVDRDRRARVADVERLADRLGMLEAGEDAAHHVGDVAPGADLRAVAADRQVLAGERRLDERADRAAADLAGPEDVERVHGDGRAGRARRGRRAPCARRRASRRRRSSAPRRPSRSSRPGPR